MRAELRLRCGGLEHCGRHAWIERQRHVETQAFGRAFELDLKRDRKAEGRCIDSGCILRGAGERPAVPSVLEEERGLSLHDRRVTKQLAGFPFGKELASIVPQCSVSDVRRIGNTTVHNLLQQRADEHVRVSPHRDHRFHGIVITDFTAS